MKSTASFFMSVYIFFVVELIFFFTFLFEIIGSVSKFSLYPIFVADAT
jgi:hypothetical protein